MGVTFRIAHISDLHFSDDATVSDPNHKHSVAHLQGLQKRLKEKMRRNDFDRLIVSGDISHRGDGPSLFLAHSWLTRTIPIGGGSETGLTIADEGQLGIVPGNHDAWNATTSRSLLERWQRSLEHYNAKFPKHTFNEWGVRHDWVERDGAGVYIAYVDSCFLGSSVGDIDTFGDFRAIAKGKLSIKQSRRLLTLYDRGVRGKLELPDGSGSIDPGIFADSLKILVMHHYLFDPKKKRKKRLMSVTQCQEVFRNIALADFDLLLCGHSHLADIHHTTYGDEFDDRAIARYLMNRFRRDLGVDSLPVRYNRHGLPISKRLSTWFNLLIRWAKRQGDETKGKALGTAFVNLLRRAIDSSEEFDAEFRKFMKDHPGVEDEISSDELEQIRGVLNSKFSVEDLKLFRVHADRLAALAKDIRIRPFMQMMNGSACKATSVGRKRCYNEYTFEKHESSGWMVQADEYAWDAETGEFSTDPLRRNQKFRQ